MFRREDCIDAEIKASGLTKQMEKDLLKEMGVIENTSDEEVEEHFDEGADEKEESVDENEINYLQLQVENSMRNDFECAKKLSEPISTSGTENLIASRLEGQSLEEGVQNIDIKRLSEDTKNSESCDLGTKQNKEFVTETSDVEDECEQSSKYSDSRSLYSTTTASTIAPELIKKRIKTALQKREKKEQSRRVLAKGEANAVTRVRRENRDTIKQSTGIWGWE